MSALVRGSMNIYSTDHSRRSIRLKSYDYAQAGAYFVTICTQNRACLFGDVVDDEMLLNRLGSVAHDEWARTPEIRQEVDFDVFQVMPNHIHGIIVIAENGSGASDVSVGAHGRAPLPCKPPTGLSRAPRSLGSIVAGFKSAATKRINVVRHTPGLPVWQRNYYERVIRNEAELNATRQNIIDNPLNWALDSLNPQPKPQTASKKSLL